MSNKIIRGLKKISDKAAQQVSSLRGSLPDLPGRGKFNLNNPKKSAVASTVAGTNNNSVRPVSWFSLEICLQNIDIVTAYVLQQARAKTDGLFRQSPSQGILNKTMVELGTNRIDEEVLKANCYLAGTILRQRLKAITPIRERQLHSMKMALGKPDNPFRDNQILTELECAIAQCPSYEQDELRRILGTFAECYQLASDATGEHFNKVTMVTCVNPNLFAKCPLNDSDAKNVHPKLAEAILRGWSRKYNTVNMRF